MGAVKPATEELPAALLIAAPARCLLDEKLAELLAPVPSGTEVRRWFVTSQRKEALDELGTEVGRQLRTSSLFAPEQILVVMEGQGLLGHASLQEWLRRPTPRTRLLLTMLYRSPRERLPEAAAKLGLEVREVPAPARPQDRQKWLEERAAREECRLSPEAFRALESLTAGSLDRMAAELDKLCLYREQGVIDAADVEALAGHPAEQDFDRLVHLLTRGRRGECLGLLEAMAEDGLRLFDGGRVHGRTAVAGTVLPILLARMRRMLCAGVPRGEVQKAVQDALKLNPWYARRLAQECASVRDQRRWLAAATAAEAILKRGLGMSDEELLLLLFHELGES